MGRGRSPLTPTLFLCKEGEDGERGLRGRDTSVRNLGTHCLSSAGDELAVLLAAHQNDEVLHVTLHLHRNKKPPRVRCHLFYQLTCHDAGSYMMFCDIKWMGRSGAAERRRLTFFHRPVMSCSRDGVHKKVMQGQSLYSPARSFRVGMSPASVMSYLRDGVHKTDGIRFQ